MWRLKDNAMQWLWFLFHLQPEYIGHDKGLLTWLRKRRHRHLRRKIHICLLEYHPKGGKFGEFMTFWINEKSTTCSASLNKRIEEADIVWVFSQDPLPDDIKEKLLQTLKRAKVGIPIINHPNFYNSYHDIASFRLMEKGGISIPRTEFSEKDIGKTLVVYKMTEKQHCPKFISFYKGQVKGFRAFEFIDSRAPGGLYRSCRVLFVAGMIVPEYIMYSDQWNITWETKKHMEYVFEITPIEMEAIRKIASILNIQFFSVDYLRRSDDSHAFFTDINVYPLPISHTEVARQFGYYSRWLRFDDGFRLGVQKFPEDSFWNKFDQAMRTFLNGEGGALKQ
jgi:hypothetical protein